MLGMGTHQQHPSIKKEKKCPKYAQLKKQKSENELFSLQVHRNIQMLLDGGTKA